MRRHLVLLLATSTGLTACGGSTVSVLQGTEYHSASAVGPVETEYCSTPRSFSNVKTVIISGSAQYIRREIFLYTYGGGLGSASLTDPTHPASLNPVRFAEVRVSDANGQLVQCAETALDGTFRFTLPQSADRFTVAVNSRAQNSHLNASVLDQPEHNAYYSLLTAFAPTDSQTLKPMVAQAKGDTLGGAFNILDQLLNANLFLAAQVGQCATQFKGCRNYDPLLHKVSAYWQKGFNPNSYFGALNSGLSFYLPGYSRLFILGGQNGDTDNSDTDHFDNSVIIHEYGHFLEDTWLKTDSPGGAHNGDEQLDPRLAWSEGWGDFFQAAVRGDNHYVDTIGNVDGSTGLAFAVDTETTSWGSDYPSAPGEGNFHEFAVTRLLWDAFDANAPGDTMFGFTDDVSGQFAEIWASLSKDTLGYRDPTLAFRNASLFLRDQLSLHLHPASGDLPASNWSNIIGLNRLEADTTHYAQYLAPVTSGTCSRAPTNSLNNPYLPPNTYYFQVKPATIAGDNGMLVFSDLFQNNRFFHLRINSAESGGHSLQLIYQDDDGSSTTADLDLYLYNAKARFAVAEDMIGFSRTSPVGPNPERRLQSEVVQATLAPGDYLIDVNVFTGKGAGATADFNLVFDGVVLCPANLVPL